jgi:hypothetical protein
MGDWLRICGHELQLFTNPLEDYFRVVRRGHRPALAPTLSSLHRGYIATWSLRGGWLRLEDLAAWVPTEDGRPPVRRVGLDELLPELTGGSRATWFSGTLRLPRGEILSRWRLGYASVYERDFLIRVERGRVLEWELVDNRERTILDGGTVNPEPTSTAQDSGPSHLASRMIGVAWSKVRGWLRTSAPPPN